MVDPPAGMASSSAAASPGRPISYPHAAGGPPTNSSPMAAASAVTAGLSPHRNYYYPAYPPPPPGPGGYYPAYHVPVGASPHHSHAYSQSHSSTAAATVRTPVRGVKREETIMTGTPEQHRIHAGMKRSQEEVNGMQLLTQATEAVIHRPVIGTPGRSSLSPNRGDHHHHHYPGHLPPPPGYGYYYYPQQSPGRSPSSPHNTAVHHYPPHPYYNAPPPAHYTNMSRYPDGSGNSGGHPFVSHANPPFPPQLQGDNAACLAHPQESGSSPWRFSYVTPSPSKKPRAIAPALLASSHPTAAVVATTDPVPSSPVVPVVAVQKPDPSTTSSTAQQTLEEMDPSYNRKDKSLGVMCAKFIRLYGSTQPGEEKRIFIDDAAKALGVERRRIYDIVNILESIEVVSRRCKNTYNWHGTHNLPIVLAELQNEAYEIWPNDIKLDTLSGGERPQHNKSVAADKSSEEENALICREDLSGSNSAGNRSNHVPLRDTTNLPSKVTPRQLARMAARGGGSSSPSSLAGMMLPKEKSLGKLTQRFVQLFLLGHDVISLSEASTKILGCPSINIKKSKGAGSSGMKTKVRRLYDIANLMCSIGLVSKAVNNVHTTTTTSSGGGGGHHHHSDALSAKCKLAFKWNYKLKPTDLPPIFQQYEATPIASIQLPLALPAVVPTAHPPFANNNAVATDVAADDSNNVTPIQSSDNETPKNEGSSHAVSDGSNSSQMVIGHTKENVTITSSLDQSSINTSWNNNNHRAWTSPLPHTKRDHLNVVTTTVDQNDAILGTQHSEVVVAPAKVTPTNDAQAGASWNHEDSFVNESSSSSPVMITQDDNSNDISSDSKQDSIALKP